MRYVLALNTPYPNNDSDDTNKVWTIEHDFNFQSLKKWYC